MLCDDLEFEELKNDSMFSGLVRYIEEVEEFLEVKEEQIAKRGAEITKLKAVLSNEVDELAEKDKYIKKLESIIRSINPDIQNYLKG